MAKKKVIDTQALLKAVKDGVAQPDIMEEFGFKTSTQLKIAYANALMESGEAPKIKGVGQKKKKPIDMKITVNNRGSLIIPKKLVEIMKVKVGETFEVKNTASGIQLKKIKVEEKVK